MDRIDHRTAERLDRLFRMHHSRLVAFAATQTRDYATAEDVVSVTWVRAAASLYQLQADDDRAYGWLRTITARAAVDQYRRLSASERPVTVAQLDTHLTPVPSAERLALARLAGSQPPPPPLPKRRPGATNPPTPSPRVQAVAA